MAIRAGGRECPVARRSSPDERPRSGGNREPFADRKTRAIWFPSSSAFPWPLWRSTTHFLAREPVSLSGPGTGLVEPHASVSVGARPVGSGWLVLSHQGPLGGTLRSTARQDPRSTCVRGRGRALIKPPAPRLEPRCQVSSDMASRTERRCSARAEGEGILFGELRLELLCDLAGGSSFESVVRAHTGDESNALLSLIGRTSRAAEPRYGFHHEAISDGDWNGALFSVGLACSTSPQNLRSGRRGLFFRLRMHQGRDMRPAVRY